MINSPKDRRVLEALASLKNQHEGIIIFNWLEGCLKDQQDKQDDILDEIVLRQTQGACKTLKMIVKAFRESRDSLDRLNTKAQSN